VRLNLLTEHALLECRQQVALQHEALDVMLIADQLQIGNAG
jgi:hypothetical protein